MNIKRVSGSREGRGRYELGEAESVFEIRSFFGLAGYYRRFINDFSRLVAPMTRLTRKEVKFEWDD